MSIVLKSSRLRVEVAEPDVDPNTPTRFDRAGFVTQVTLDGKHQFCTREPNNVPHPPTAGVGLCSEYRCNEPVDEAQVGDQFVKFGVGLLTKDLEGRYVFHHRYPCQPFAVSVQVGAADALFETAPRECQGYAARTIKQLTVAGNELTMTMTLENVGQRPIAFDEYCHNFVTIDRLPLGPGYYLAMPVGDQTGKPPMNGVALAGQGGGVAVKQYSNEPSMFGVDTADVNSPAPFAWKLTHSESPASIAETVSAMPSRIMVWAIDHIISPEIICHFEAAPGESVTWTRRWAFAD